MELIQVGERTYYLKNPTNIGIYQIDEKYVYVIDSGNDKEAGKKILKIIEEQGWKIKAVINTHSNADHIGGNKVIQDRTGCDVLAHRIESCFTQFPILEPSFLYGGYPFKELRNKFLLAKESRVKPIENNLPEGLEYFPLKGHFFDMVGIKTSDNIYFLADSLFSKETIDKYHLFFVYDVKEFFRTLEFLKTLKGTKFIPSHGEETENIHSLIEMNEKEIVEILEKIVMYLKEEATFEEILQYIFYEYQLTMNAEQYVLIGSTIKSYLSYLEEENRITYSFSDHKMKWKQK